MRRSQQNLFARLDDRRRTLPQHQVQLPQRARKFTVTHEPITIGDWAGYLHMRSKTLIATFSRAGVRGLTPNHLLDPAHAKALLAYLQAEQQSRTTEVYADQGPLDSKIIIVQSLSTQLLEELAKRPKLMYQLEPRKFEELVAKLLEDQGCDVTLTKRTRDGGYDLFGSMKTGPTEVVFLAECKRYSPENKVGVELVRNLYGVTEIHKANLGLLITSSTFTPDAQQEKIRIGPRISLKDYEDLKIWLARYQPKGPGILLS